MGVDYSAVLGWGIEAPGKILEELVSGVYSDEPEEPVDGCSIHGHCPSYGGEYTFVFVNSSLMIAEGEAEEFDRLPCDEDVWTAIITEWCTKHHVPYCTPSWKLFVNAW